MNNITTSPSSDSEVFLTDAELRARWKCSDMKLWRLRNSGRLAKPIKLTVGGMNLTRLSDARAAEGAGND